ncbi:MAG TPA: aminotransferase class I/II-fold pyridoxal phosphate-dependent enzyme [Clostridia bacterium]|jgi:arginine/lysine/ornithine decarboxylase|nr:aminotransferase class I/II-fold pyridoxal phosphate-dependent enzyme [Clostridia bacterium]HQM96678.1 aminotransferase class I/II-fold pyridoxal phosphate-dependent enzyme [Clostridia bacterium]HQO69682.1 aminotransferase class I/II-fold pyridoxal phosphate-dependent enzyme [Clostridia bacterium]
MTLTDQNRAPLYEALEELKTMHIVPFDVPGHKRGKGNKDLADFLGAKCLAVDINSMKYLDNICHPTGVIKEAEELTAQAFGAKHAYFMVNGTTSAVQSMVLYVVKRGDKIILPRNVHRSVINAFVLCGAVPVYINPQINSDLGISLGMAYNDVVHAIEQNPDAKAVFVNNPTYYGICSNLRKITELAHKHNMLVLVDEAHGTHLYFGEDLPVSAMAAGADMASVSMHKSGGSLTQSSLLLSGDNINSDYLRQVVNLTQTTSGSYLLMSSLDISRRRLFLHGKEIFKRVSELAQYARDEINEIGDYYAYSRELVNGDTVFDFDVTKLSINTSGVGLAGIEVFDLLRDEYDIQIEFGDLENILAYISVGDSDKNIEQLIGSLSEIRRRYKKARTSSLKHEYINPVVEMSPQDAFYAKKISMDIRKTAGEICGEFVMAYPPGIPILAPGERITEQIIDYIIYAKEKGSLITGPEDMHIQRLNILQGGR